jgi:UDP-N-acetyl-D-galactosamine dehydrogenase
MVHDPLASPHEAKEEYGLALSPLEEVAGLDALVCAVSHEAYRAMGAEALFARVRDGGVVVDVKSMLDPSRMNRTLHYWSL